MISKESLTNGWTFQPSSNDIFVAAFPKSGMTWMIQLVHEVMTRGKGFQFNQNIDDIHAWLEVKDGSYLDPSKLPTKHFRIIKTHQPIRHQSYSSKAKYIVVLRDPGNCFTSLCKCAAAMSAQSPRDISTRIMKHFCTSSFNFGGWVQHVSGWWKLRNRPNVLVVRYEEMKKNFSDILNQVASFLQIYDLNQGEKDDINMHCSFQYMKNNPDMFQPRYITQKLKRANNQTYQLIDKEEIGSFAKCLAEPTYQKALYDYCGQQLKRMGVNDFPFYGISKEYHVDESVEYKTKSGWKQGLIKTVNKDGTYNILCSDETIENNWKSKDLRIPTAMTI